ncbi:MAG TPA: hypothetical protein VGW40_08655 [Allosphingosinicella sp.]|nr:hypothetical protein [Allosphingosinicella sp.]
MKRVGGIAALLCGLCAVPAFGSGGPPAVPQYIDHHGGTAAELDRLYRGRAGLVMVRSHAPMLYLQWRLLHGLEVGREAGQALAPPPCCDESAGAAPYRDPWQEARALVVGAPDSPSYVALDRPGPDYTRIDNCFPDAFDTAAATLRSRIAGHGASDPAVRAWLAAQDAVFAACSNTGAALPPLPAAAPAWLREDRAYQEAAFALYNFRNAEAATRFAAIAGDPGSPWRPMGLYLGVRALHREAVANPSPANFARARRVIAALAATPAGTYGRSQATAMRRWLDFRERPAALLAELDRELGAAAPPGDPIVSLRDYLRLAGSAPVRPDTADWILTLQSEDRAAAQAHARARWAASRDPAWLIAALSLTGPGDADAESLAADAARVGAGEAAWPSARYHLIRLTIATAASAETRARLDAILARGDLTLSERNVFSALRAQAAADLEDFARFALRRPYCVASSVSYCLSEGWAEAPRTLGRRDGAWLGLGADARAIIDRLPLSDRIALSRSPALPEPVRLDLALTGFARAVLSRDEAAIGALAGDLARLLPQLRADWRAIAALPPGPARRFAAYFAMAKIPGLRADLVDYTRPRGTVRQFEGYWVDWLILPRGRAGAASSFPAPARYVVDDYWYDDGEHDGDLTCLGHCGRGAAPLRLPRFVAARAARAAAERAAFAMDSTVFGRSPPALPAGTLSLWEETLAYARAHPRDPRSPEALYWLIRIARWGGNHEHSGRRAFQLLHRRYPGSAWARRSPYYYDDPRY